MTDIHTAAEPAEGAVRLTQYGEAYTRVDHLEGSDARWWVAPDGDLNPPFRTGALTWEQLQDRGPLTEPDARLAKVVHTAVVEQLSQATA